MKSQATRRPGAAALSFAIIAAASALPHAAFAAATCDDTLKAAFADEPQTTVVVVKPFRKGEQLILSEAATPYTQKAASDLCMVKIVVGPGNPGPAAAPSTSPGIGIEIWLPSPAGWNGRIHALGGGGWVGGPAGSPMAVFEPRAAGVASNEGAVSSASDAGHPRPGAIPGKPGGGDFAMNPDGSINEVLWRDFASRAVHEQAVKTRTLAAFYYGRPAKYAYWDGASNGGRQALNLAQNHPDDFDGILANLPAINWMSFAIGDLYPQLVFQRDLGGQIPSEAQQDLVSNAAIRACDVVGGQHLGYIMDMGACRYDPTRDKQVLCRSDGGSNATADCVTRKQALAFNKIWYGMTADGSVPSPAARNGWEMELGGVRRWYGLPRGTSLYNIYFSRMMQTSAGLTNPAGPFSIAADAVALALEDPKIAAPNFENATGNGANGWKALSYRQLSQAFDRAAALQARFGHIDSNNPDLSAFKASGGKMLTYHGIHDEVIPVQGTIRYYNQVIGTMGGLAAVQGFYRFYVVPGVGHATPNGTANPNANPPVIDNAKFYQSLVDWVEKGVVPDRLEITTPTQSPIKRSQPICPYPQRAKYIAGDPNAASSFVCSRE